jgi:hypothetical protein
MNKIKFIVFLNIINNIQIIYIKMWFTTSYKNNLNSIFFVRFDSESIHFQKFITSDVNDKKYSKNMIK